ncbi:hypothetical protein ZWY2020_043583 [Hordeum vulgare]|nr:hypothetical protein ZWY2020_043583 [Hordeum vulgare]
MRRSIPPRLKSCTSTSGAAAGSDPGLPFWAEAPPVAGSGVGTAVMCKSNDILGKQTALKATWLGKRCCRCHAGLWFRSMPTIVMPHRGCLYFAVLFSNTLSVAMKYQQHKLVTLPG